MAEWQQLVLWICCVVMALWIVFADDCQASIPDWVATEYQTHLTIPVASERFTSLSFVPVILLQ